MLGDMEMLVVLAVAAILFGPEKLPQAARQFGRMVARIREEFEEGQPRG
jgi:TatA/E family protein of Tat protein translocase